MKYYCCNHSKSDSHLCHGHDDFIKGCQVLCIPHAPARPRDVQIVPHARALADLQKTIDWLVKISNTISSAGFRFGACADEIIRILTPQQIP